MRIESVRIKNFKALQDVVIDNISNMTVFVGKNGVGKTTFFSVFRFLRDCLETNVSKALRNLGGYDEVVSRGKNGENIYFEVKFRSDGNKPPLITYELEITNVHTKPEIAKETLRYRRKR